MAGQRISTPRKNPWEDEGMGRHSRQKGKAGEREAAAVLQQHWNASEARRAQQFCGAAGDADLLGLPGLHCEVKRYAAIGALKFLEQAERDAKPGCVPFVMMRQDGDTEWAIMLRPSDAPQFARCILEMIAERNPIPVEDNGE